MRRASCTNYEASSVCSAASSFHEQICCGKTASGGEPAGAALASWEAEG